MSDFTDKTTAALSRAIDALLGNEALTDRLADEPARLLLDWGTACTRQIFEHFPALDPQDQEELLAPRLKAVRRLMRSLNQWVPERLAASAESNQESLQALLPLMAEIDSTGPPAPGAAEMEEFWRQHASLPDGEFLAALRRFLGSI